MNGYKDIETEAGHTPRYTGPLLIHASKSCTKKEYQEAVDFVQAIDATIAVPALEEMDRGGIVGEVFMVGAVKQSISPWFTGPVGLALTKPRVREFSPCKGQLGFFNPPTEEPK